MEDIPDEPRIPQGSPSHHDSVATRLPKHSGRIFGTANIATPDHGDPQPRLQSGNKPPVRLAAEALIHRTRVEDNGIYTTFLSDTTDSKGIDFAMAPSGADLEGKGNFGRLSMA